jgi:nicotinamide mononucleotide (NMN) deamidase PncC
VAYQPDVKQKLLGVSDRPVVSKQRARWQPAVRAAMEADIGIALTGVGPPSPTEGPGPGSVWLAATA